MHVWVCVRVCVCLCILYTQSYLSTTSQDRNNPSESGIHCGNGKRAGFISLVTVGLERKATETVEYDSIPYIISAHDPFCMFHLHQLYFPEFCSHTQCFCWAAELIKRIRLTNHRNRKDKRQEEKNLGCLDGTPSSWCSREIKLKSAVLV